MKCKKCGAELQEGRIYCECGERIEDVAKLNFREIVGENISKNDFPITGSLKGMNILSVAILFCYILLRIGLQDMDWDDAITLTQWVRFSAVAFAFCGFSTVIFDRENSKRIKAFTILVIVTLVIITCQFLFPELSAGDLWDKII